MIASKVDCQNAGIEYGFNEVADAGPEWHAGCIRHGGKLYYSAPTNNGAHDTAVSDGYLCSRTTTTTAAPTTTTAAPTTEAAAAETVAQTQAASQAYLAMAQELAGTQGHTHVDEPALCAHGQCMETQSNLIQLGAMPYLVAGTVTDTETECKQLCLDDPRCKYGTYVTNDAALSDSSHAFKQQAIKGECWLSEHTHERPTACGVPCSSFQRTENTESTAPARTLNHLHKDAERCRMRSELPYTHGPEQSHHPCDPQNPDPLVFMECMRSCAHRGHFTHQRTTCKCDVKDPSQQSQFTTCHKDPFGQSIKVSHIEPRFHTKNYRGGEQHRCQMVKDDPTCSEADKRNPNPGHDGDHMTYGDQDRWQHEWGAEYTCAKTCKCCDCRDHGSFFEIIDIGFGIHTAAEPFLTSEPPMVHDAHECMQLCHEHPRCRAGSYMSDSDHKGQCWLSENIEVGKKCENTCESFVKINKESEQVCDMDPMKVLRRKISGMTCRERPEAPPCDCPNEFDPVSCAGEKSYSSLCHAHCEHAASCKMVNPDQGHTCNRITCAVTENLIGTDKNGCGGVCETKPDYTVCCTAITQGCLACQAGLSSAQDYCYTHPDAHVCRPRPVHHPDHPDDDKEPVQTNPCCKAMTIPCLACQAGLSADETYCLQHPHAPVCSGGR
jgi:hypothetical protein